VNHARRFPRFWLAYFACTAAIVVGGITYDALTGFEGGPLSVAWALYGLLSLVPLYGFCRQRRIPPRWAWIVLLVLSAASSVVVIGACLYTIATTGSAGPLVQLVFVLLFGGVYSFALYQYTFRNASLWGPP
jgi:hypothetical protein